MSEINAALNSSEFHNLVKALKNNVNWQDKITDTLLKVKTPKLPKQVKVKENKKFKKHPDYIDSEGSLITEKNEHSDKSVAFIFKTGVGMSESLSDDNFFDNDIPLVKHFEEKDFKSLPIFKMPHEPEVSKFKKRLKVKHPARSPTPRSPPPRKHQEDMRNTRSAIERIHFEQKLEKILSNVISTSEKIRIVMDAGIPPPDGDEEWQRRYARAKEFYSRFCRNYLYHLGRQVTDLENYYIKCSGRSSNRSIENVQQHLLSVYNIILNALQTYHSHMSTSLSYVASDKLMNIFETICKCCVITNKFIHRDGENTYKFEHRIEEVSKISKNMVDKLAQILFETPQLYCLTLASAKSMRKGYKWEVKPPQKKKKPETKTRLDTRFSMYSMSTNAGTKNYWKKTVEDLTKQKFKYSHVQSRYKTAVFKHRLPIEKPSVNELPTRFRFLDKRSSSLLRNSPLLTPDREDEIVTMVELDHQREKDPHKLQRVSPGSSNDKVGTSKKLDVLNPLIQGLCHKICTQDGKNVTENKLENLLKNFLEMALDGKINSAANTTEMAPIKNGRKSISAVDKLDLGESSECQTNTVTLNSPNLENKSQNNKNKNDKNLNTYVDFIKNIRLELDSTTGSSEKPRKMRSCTSLIKTIESSTDLDDTEICVENRHKAKFTDDSKINCKREERSSKTCKKKRRQTVTVSGEKNAQLICIKDEDSIVEVSEEESMCKNKHKVVVNQSGPCINKVELVRHNRSLKKVITTNRLPMKYLRKLELLPTTMLYDVINYKISYKKYSKLNPMYQKSPTIQPWEIVDSISEHLLNELLIGVTRELEENDILENIYESEFC